MTYRFIIPAALFLCGLMGGVYFLGVNSRKAEILALQAGVKKLEELNRSQENLLAEHYGISWETLEKKDPITRKHLIMAIWYGSQEAGNYFLGRDTGHVWGPRWNRRSPLSILDEQTEVMRGFLSDLRKLEEASPQPPRYPTEDHRDPSDGSRIAWENYLETGDEANPRTVWYGKSKGTGDFMAFEHGKGVYKPDSDLLLKIMDHKESEDEENGSPPDDEGDPFLDGE